MAISATSTSPATTARAAGDTQAQSGRPVLPSAMSAAAQVMLKAMRDVKSAAAAHGGAVRNGTTDADPDSPGKGDNRTH